VTVGTPVNFAAILPKATPSIPLKMEDSDLFFVYEPGERKGVNVHTPRSSRLLLRLEGRFRMHPRAASEPQMCESPSSAGKTYAPAENSGVRGENETTSYNIGDYPIILI
jgi:hypothetical protein